ncbi:MAG TPA: substrate-binding domain-containing protein [Candidatus Avoscillospira stercorigallinarum]|uniref:Substrate-binding domain-containing protein n=1 Tax=Candidatus Avoscillospira stercorigallinarum TaxID=2840708 RepID=A0A9D0Z7A7_9FIRM|nr:substrate-binding domain-containing protein [Candidatus Avoscillospira stercorigallinarum]
MKKILALMLALTLVLGLAACAGTDGQSETNQTETNQTEDTAAPETGDETAADAETDAETEGDTAAAMSGPITVISREEGSGTRGAFVELMGVETDEGDMTTVDAEIANSTSLVQSTVAGNPNAIGYISLGSYDASAVKALKVDGVEVSVDTIKAGEYAVSRPFVVCYKEENLSELGKDFVSYIMSAEGQAILSEEGYIAADDAAESYTAAGLSGNLSVNGSTSVGPVMEVLAEAYKALNPDVVIDVQQTGSGTGITSAIDGSCEIGMSSRALKDEEVAEGLTPVTIALDGIAVIVNQANTVEDLTAEQIRQIYTGEITDWSQLG